MWTAKGRAEGPYYGDNYITLVEIERMTSGLSRPSELSVI